MVIAYDEETVVRYMKEAVEYSQDRPVLIDHFLEECDRGRCGRAVRWRRRSDRRHHAAHRRSRAFTQAIRLVCCLRRRYSATAICSIGCAITPSDLARALNVVGLMNIQFAIPRGDGGYNAQGNGAEGGTVYVLEVNPQSVSRTVPYVSKATGVPMAKIAARLMTGRKAARISPGERQKQNADLDTGQLFLREVAGLSVE